jgi:hypothetical protein
MFHIRTENLERAMQWFRSDVFKEATQRATVRGREFYIADSGVVSGQRPTLDEKHAA